MSDASEDGALYDKLPRYLTNVSVQTVESRSIQDDHGYNRLPSYLIKPQQSLLKTNLSKALAEKNNIVISSVDTTDQKWPAAIISDVKAEVSVVDPNTTGVKLENINEEIKTVEYKVKDMVKSKQGRYRALPICDVGIRHGYFLVRLLLDMVTSWQGGFSALLTLSMDV